MTTTKYQVLDVIALLEELPDHGLQRGHQGTIVDMVDDRYLVEFSTDDGQAIATPVLRADQMLRLIGRQFAESV